MIWQSVGAIESLALISDYAKRASVDRTDQLPDGQPGSSPETAFAEIMRGYAFIDSLRAPMMTFGFRNRSTAWRCGCCLQRLVLRLSSHKVIQRAEYRVMLIQKTIPLISGQGWHECFASLGIQFVIVLVS